MRKLNLCHCEPAGRSNPVYNNRRISGLLRRPFGSSRNDMRGFTLAEVLTDNNNCLHVLKKYGILVFCKNFMPLNICR
jgi:hypothetical protein